MILFSKFSLPKRKSLSYFGMLVLIFLFLELLFNFSAIIFSNTTNTIRLKSAMFLNRSQTEILFLGSSRFSDGISAKVFRKRLEISDKTLKAFNGGITGATMERLEYFFNNAVAKEGLKHIIIEISKPQLRRTPIDISADEEYEDNLETELSIFFEEHSKLVRWRKSLRLDNLKNVPIILFSNHVEGSELFRRGSFSDLIEDKETIIDDTILKTWQPSVIEPQDLKKDKKYENSGIVDYDFMLSIFKKMVKKAKQRNVEIILVVPPLVNTRLKEEHSKEFISLYQALSNETAIPIYDFTAINIPETYFRDKDSHLNKAGRDLFSTKLADIMLTKLNKQEGRDVIQ